MEVETGEEEAKNLLSKVTLPLRKEWPSVTCPPIQGKIKIISDFYRKFRQGRDCRRYYLLGWTASLINGCPAELDRDSLLTIPRQTPQLRHEKRHPQIRRRKRKRRHQPFPRGRKKTGLQYAVAIRAPSLYGRPPSSPRDHDLALLRKRPRRSELQWSERCEESLRNWQMMPLLLPSTTAASSRPGQGKGKRGKTNSPPP